ncbi:hypothetical protein JOF41_000747 [Saccharothrix coeruleofusca]|uniref:DUF397 domain-containing protein n=1 Tax=Saccharothrix coeruleofusca TaxID=33919 RepID=UPI001AE5C422|nr:DUF397 domain-containing protein [Saccharothrix coeruleofusca]MBP2334569.1 hypothetical protein [Saccharothrix coeruleofusca]
MSASTWRKSTYSGNDSNCVEVALGSDTAGVRDSKRPAAGHLSISTSAFQAFVRSLKIAV